jgi:pentatricopeptide repeat protein
MVNKGISPNIMTYNSIVKSYCQSGNVKNTAIFAEDEVNVLPDLITYNTLIHGYVKEEDVHEAFNVLKMMEMEMVQPDVTYNMLINGFSVHDNMEEAGWVFKKIITRGIEPEIYIHVHDKWSCCSWQLEGSISSA